MSQLFSELLTMTTQQSEPQRLLFLFAQTDEKNPKKSKKHKKGTITPTMCVDKLPTQLTTFENLVAEADNISKDWDFIFIAGLSGQNGQAPSEDDAEPYLNKMTNDVASGSDLSRYVVLDRQEQAMDIQGH
ncbi:MAG: hypothetical protein ACI8SR_002179 [Oceanicoccus sp.]|jgi:hypothetical protein